MVVASLILPAPFAWLIAPRLQARYNRWYGHLCGSKLLRHPTVKSFAQPKGKRAVSAVYRLHPVSERRLRRRGILQGHHFGHGAGLELDELINHC